MSKPKQDDQSFEYTVGIDFLYEILAKATQSANDVKNLLKDLLTTAEIRMINNRWHIARLLDSGLSVRQVATQAKVGTDTVERVSRKLQEGTGGLQKAIEATREPWQEKLLAKKGAAKKLKVVKSIDRWVFGSGKQDQS